ncbi:hypothetical protein DPMN_023871 [Dreissena polymorpha]|uniref:Uncharacterized protein n=1 Tax=Dreissena polymorpha TaxID=45954 RepID=A0A9D4LLN2_DREPO|nr:hypothetical protein DPMN_023871 [Dreissena polymorpha]
MTGLAGNVQDGHFVSQNGSEYPVNASEHDMFDYGESCEYLDNLRQNPVTYRC